MTSEKSRDEPEGQERAVWVWDPDLARILWANPAGLEFWGEPGQIDLMERWFDPDSALAQHLASLNASLKEGQTIRITAGFAPEGSVIHVECLVRRCPLQDGRSGLRIETDRHRPAPHRATPVQPASRQLEITPDGARMNEICARAPFPILLCDGNGRTLFENTASARHFGDACPTLVARYGSENRVMHAVRAALANESFSHTAHLNTRIGKRRFRVTMRRIHDPVIARPGVIVTAHDITCRDEMVSGEMNGNAQDRAPPPAMRSAETPPAVPGSLFGHLDGVLAAMNIAALHVDDALRIVAATRGSAPLLNCEEAALENAPFLSLFEAGAEKRIETCLREGTVANGQDVSEGVLARLRGASEGEKGATVSILTVKEPARRDGGQLVFVRRTAAPATLSERDASEHIARVSHELRSPLTSILGFVEIMLAHPDHITNPRFVEYLRDILGTGRHMSDILDDLIDVHRVSIDAIPLCLERVEPNALIRTALRLNEPAAEKNGITLQTALAEPSCAIMADGRLLRQMIDNLLANAIKYAGHGAKVHIRTRCDAAKGFLLQIEDDGIGMDAAELHDAMQPYGRTKAGIAAAKGAGLGLPLTRAFANRSGARFQIRSRKGEGAGVRIVFPPDRIVVG